MATPLTLQSGVGSNSAGGALTLLPGISEGTDKAGANLTLNGGQGTGTGTGGSIIFKVADGGLGSSANTNTLQKALEIKDNGEIVTSGSHYIASAANASWGGLEVSPTLTFTGSTSVTNASPINMVSLSAPTLNCGSAMNVDTAASLYVAGAPSTGGSLTISNSYSLFVDAGTTRLDGGLNLAGTLVTATAAELNILDGGTSATATTVESGDRVVYNDAGTMKQVDVDDIDTYFSGTTKTLTSKTLTSAVLTTPQINDASADHKYTFAVSELVANRTVTLPLLSGDDTFVFKDHTETLTNKTLTAPKIANDGYIADENNNEQIKFTTTGSAINEFTIKNAASGNSPEIQASGDDTNIDIKVVPKGNGNLSVKSGGLSLAGTNSLSTAKLYMLGNFSTTAATNATEGFITEIAANTITDNQSGNSQTRTEFYAHKIGTPTIAAANTGVSVTDAATLYVESAPTPGTNMTLTKANALVVNSGGSEFRGRVICTAAQGISATAAGGLIAGTSSNTVGKLTLHCSNSANHTTIKAALSNTVQIDYTLPSALPPNPVSQYFLTSTTNGVMSWATNAGGGGGGGGGSTTNIYDITDNVSAGGATGLVIDGSGGPSFTATNTNTVYNVGLGYSVFKTNTTGGYNTLMGYSVGNSITSGSSNTLIGSGAGGTLATGNNNTCLGYNASVSASGVNNEITLGNNAVTDLRCADTTIASLSDSRDKTDIIDLPWGLDFIDSLRPVQFTWDRRVLTPDDENWPMNGKKRAGFIAQDLQSAMTDNANEVLDLVYTSNPERLEVKQGKLVPILTQAIKELKAELDTLKAEVAALKNASN